MWFVNHPMRPTQPGSAVLAGPQMFDFSIQAPIADIPETIRPAQFDEIRARGIALVERSASVPGVFGLEVFVSPDGRFMFNMMTVRGEDKMFATFATMGANNVFSMVRRTLEGEVIESAELTETRYSGGVKSIVTEGGAVGELIDIRGIERAKRVRYVNRIEIYTQKRELRPHRMYGLIYVRAPRGTPLETVRAAMEEARGCIALVYNPTERDPAARMERALVKE
jgi:formate-dependent phosphoribosylglycinamide formyltransferase (GAR transformylase)